MEISGDMRYFIDINTARRYSDSMSPSCHTCSGRTVVHVGYQVGKVRSKGEVPIFRD